jgi:hypothetical protein
MAVFLVVQPHAEQDEKNQVSHSHGDSIPDAHAVKPQMQQDERKQKGGGSRSANYQKHVEPGRIIVPQPGLYAFNHA